MAAQPWGRERSSLRAEVFSFSCLLWIAREGMRCDIGISQAQGPLDRSNVHLLDARIVQCRFQMAKGRVPHAPFAVLFAPHNRVVSIGAQVSKFFQVGLKLF